MWMCGGFIMPTHATLPSYANLCGEEYSTAACVPQEAPDDFIPAAVYDHDKALAYALDEPNPERRAFLLESAHRAAV